MDPLCEGHRAADAALFAMSLRDYLDSCKTACNLAARGDGGTQPGHSAARNRPAHLLSPRLLENTRAHTDMQKHAGNGHKGMRAHRHRDVLSGKAVA